jgi:hypothetical protein
MKARTYLLFSGVIFGLVCLGHLLRVVFNVPLVVGTYDVPMTISWMGMFVSAGLVVWVIAMLTREESG